MKLEKDFVLFKKNNHEWYLFKDPVEIVTGNNISKIKSQLEYIESKTKEGFYAAGFLSYEASKAFENRFCVKQNNTSPDIWFGLYKERKVVKHTDLFNGKKYPVKLKWKLPLSKEEYSNGINYTKDRIKNGDIYQLNYTFVMNSDFNLKDLSSFDIFESCFAELDSSYLAFINTKDFSVLSGSPELFFLFKDNQLVSKPMKGTASRGRFNLEDDLNIKDLYHSEKNRAENVMIVDMIRNDMGKIAKTSSIEVTKLFEIEKYSKVLQMTSTIKSYTDKSVLDIFQAMFPCASITGAPKIRAMECINCAEKSARGIYTGSIGFITPAQDALFNVAIRTLYINKNTKKAYFGTGGGIVWDSQTQSEYLECMDKALIISDPDPDFCLLETMLYTPDKGFYLKNLHIKRILRSAKYFNFDLNEDELNKVLNGFKKSCCSRVRLTLDKRGKITLEHTQIADRGFNKTKWRVCIHKGNVNSKDRFLYHKTTNRQVYTDALNANPGFDDVILKNEKNEITESCFGNIIIKKKNEYLTPYYNSGLLNGTMREFLLQRKKVKEAVISESDLYEADKIFIINSVRGFIKLKLTF